MFSAGHRARRFGAIALAIVAALALAIVFFPWNALRGPLASYLSHKLDRPVAIDGALRVHPGWTTRVEIDGLTIGNASWSDIQPMASARSLALTFGLRSLLRLTPDTVRLTNPLLVLERNAAGEANWHFGSGDNGRPPRLGVITVDTGTLRYRDATLPADVTVNVQTVAPAAGVPSALRFEGSGNLRDDPFTIAGEGRGLAELRQVDDPYQLAFEARAGRTQIGFDGTIVPASPQDLRGMLRLRGQDLSELHPIVPSPLPWTPPYELAGELAHAKRVWDFHRIEGTVGDSDLAGDFKIDLSGPRPLTTAELSSRRFDYKDLGGFIGLPPGEPTRKAATPAQRKEAQRRASTSRALPDKPYAFDRLRTHDVDLKFKGRSFRWGRFPLDNLVAHLKLRDGVLRFEPLDFGVADGHVVGSITLDANREVPVAQAEVEVRNVELKRLFPQLASPRGSAGRFGGRGHFRTTGHSVAQMFAAADGEGAIAMRGGEASTLQLVLTNLDLARAAQLLIRGDETAEIRCAIAAVQVKRGVLVPDLMVIDTSEELIRGTGSVDLAAEKYDLRLQADSKQPSLLALRGPVTIGGTFKAPVVRPAIGQVVARIGASVGLGALAPPLALLPLIDLGDAPDADCRALYQDARIKSDTNERIARPNGPAKQPRIQRGKDAVEPMAGSRRTVEGAAATF